jgi:hypothetical protein
LALSGPYKGKEREPLQATSIKNLRVPGRGSGLAQSFESIVTEGMKRGVNHEL